LSHERSPAATLGAIGEPDVSPTAMALPQVRLVGDLVCPWCYLAFHRLMRVAEEAPFGFTWHPFLLNPNLPPSGIPRHDYVLRRYGSIHGAEPGQRRAIIAAGEDGLEINPARIEREPSTVLAHGLLLRAGPRLPALARALFEAYFRDGQDIGNPVVLRPLAAQFSLELTGASIATVTSMHEAACRAGVEGVPMIIVGDDHVIAGAQPLPALSALLTLERYRIGLTLTD
jgi:predicted DsbA family dithiol-disulfide isomerase